MIIAGLFDGFYRVDAALRSVVWPPEKAKAGSDFKPMPHLLTIDKIRYQWLATTRTYFVDLVFNVL